jgi:hypothetical protein
MKTRAASTSRLSPHLQGSRGSALLTALIFAVLIVIAVVSSITLSTQSLKLAHRTFFGDAANNLAETGIEEAVWSFNKMGLSTDTTTVATAWSGWTLGNALSDAYMSGTGDGYTSAPTVSFTGGGGTGATAVANLVTYYTIDPSTLATITHVGVGSITITNPGSGYTSAPTLTLSGGGCTLAATAVARLAATRTFSFPNLDQGASGTAKVWVAGYDGTAVVPNIVAKATITPTTGPKIEKTIKIILSKNGVLPKGVVAKIGINWNGHPLADSFLSNMPAGTPPFATWVAGTARANTTLASLAGTIDLSSGTVAGNIMTGPGVTVTDAHASVTGSKIGNFSYDFRMPTYPTNTGATGYHNLGTSLPATLPRAGDPLSPTDNTYYYFVRNTTIGNTTITPGAKVVIVASNTDMGPGFKVPASDPATGTNVVGSCKIYMDGPITLSGSDNINLISSPQTSWAGALEIYTTTTSDLRFSGNAKFVGCIFAPNAEIRGNGGGSDQQDLIGSFVAKSVTSNGHMNFHFDEALGTTTSTKAWGLALWKELHTPEERSLYAPQLSF